MHYIVFLLIQVFTYLHLSTAFVVSKPPFDSLNIHDMIGTHMLSLEHETPPSVMMTSWYFLLKRSASDNDKIGYGCPDDSTLCGRISTKDNDNSPIQLFSVSENNVNYSINNETSDIVASWNAVKYGEYTIDVTVNFQCSDSEDSLLEWLNDSIVIKDNLNFNWKSKQFCSKDNDGDKPKSGNDGQTSSGFGFFGTIILIMAVAFAGYLIAQAWFNTSTMGSSGDFFNELVDAVIESISSIPHLFIEIVNKITGNSNSSRGGYSAV